MSETAKVKTQCPHCGAGFEATVAVGHITLNEPEDVPTPKKSVMDKLRGK